MSKVRAFLFVWLVIFLVFAVVSSCAPTNSQNVPPDPADKGVPTLIVDIRALYDRNDNFVGYRYIDGDKGVTCYVFYGLDTPWCYK